MKSKKRSVENKYNWSVHGWQVCVTSESPGLPWYGQVLSVHASSGSWLPQLLTGDIFSASRARSRSTRSSHTKSGKTLAHGAPTLLRHRCQSLALHGRTITSSSDSSSCAQSVCWHAVVAHFSPHPLEIS